MKKLLLLLTIILLTCLNTIAQNFPKGMKYQAVARDNSGQLLVEKNIELQVSLFSLSDREENGKITAYQETHNVTTNQLGLFSLNIGEGEAGEGDYEEVPWSENEIWMEVAISTNESGEFSVISESQLLAVPYAIHALSAKELTGEDSEKLRSFTEGGVWEIGGNLQKPAQPSTMGTLDNRDLFFITNGTTRMTITNDGNVNIANDLNIEGNVEMENLTVRQEVNLNSEGGKTNINGPTTIQNNTTINESLFINKNLEVYGETELIGAASAKSTLEVGSSVFLNTTNGVTEINGPTSIYNTLDVDESTHINKTGGSTRVDGPTAIHNTLDVDASTYLNKTGGSTRVDGPTAIHNTLDVDASTYLNKTGGTTRVDGPTAIKNTLDVDASTHLNKTGGSTTVEGPTAINNTLDVNSSAHLNKAGGTTTVDGITTITNVTNSTAPTNGALNVDGGAGIEKDLSVGGALKLGGTFEVRTNANSGSLGGHVAEFENFDDGNGISIKVGSAQPKNNNNFITFKNNGGTVVGRIEGESSAADLANNLKYQDQLDYFDGDIVMAQRDIDAANNDVDAAMLAENITNAELVIVGVDLIITTAELGMAIADATASVTSATACAGLGACVTLPIPSFIVSSAANVIVAIANEVSAIANVATATANKITAGQAVDLSQASKSLAELNKENIIGDKATFINTHNLLKGVTYASGAGDYAEYLPKLDLKESFKPGEVIGLKDGKVSRNTLGADRIMVVSFKPAVLGALPEEGKEGDFVKVAFLGQILTRTIGKVSKGDYILPSGFHNGLAIAKSSENMLISDYKKILGVAWTDAPNAGVNFVNVAVGLNSNDMSNVIQQQKQEMDILKGQMEILADLVPGFREAAKITSPNNSYMSSPNNSVSEVDHHDHAGHDHDHHTEYRSQHNTEMVAPSADEIIYYEYTDEDCKIGIEVARKVMIERGLDLSRHPFWSRLDTDPDYEEEIIQRMKKDLRQSIHSHVEVNKGN